MRAGLVGRVMSVHVGLHWDHRWIAGTRFAAIPDVVMYDFGVHWFDFVTSVMDRPARRVMAQAVAGPATGFPPMLASALLDFGDAQASLVFGAATPFGPLLVAIETGVPPDTAARGNLVSLAATFAALAAARTGQAAVPGQIRRR